MHSRVVGAKVHVTQASTHEAGCWANARFALQRERIGVFGRDKFLQQGRPLAQKGSGTRSRYASPPEQLAPHHVRACLTVCGVCLCQDTRSDGFGFAVTYCFTSKWKSTIRWRQDQPLQFVVCLLLPSPFFCRVFFLHWLVNIILPQHSAFLKPVSTFGCYISRVGCEKFLVTCVIFSRLHFVVLFKRVVVWKGKCSVGVPWPSARYTEEYTGRLWSAETFRSFFRKRLDCSKKKHCPEWEQELGTVEIYIPKVNNPLMPTLRQPKRSGKRLSLAKYFILLNLSVKF